MTDDLIAAVVAGDLELVRTLIETEPGVARARNEQGTSALLLSLYNRKSEIAELIRGRVQPLDVFEAAAVGDVGRLATVLDEDPKLVDATAGDGFYPLGLAAFFGHAGAVRLLLERGADVEHAAANAMKVRAIHAAAAGGGASIVRDLLASGADPDSRQHGGFTALMEAANNGDVEMVDALLSSGADRSLTDDQGHTARDLATQAGHPDLAQRL